MKKSGLFILLILLAALAAAVFFWAASYRKALPVQAAKVQPYDLQSSISTNGKIEADKVYELHAPFSGIVRTIEARLGQRVGIGQPIFTVHDSSLDSELRAAQAELAAARLDLQNIRRGPAKEEVDQADAEVARLKLEVESDRKIVDTNEWLLKRDAISRFDVDLSRRTLEIARQSLAAAETRRKDLDSRTTPADLERANTRVEAAEAKLRLLETNNSRSLVKAPAPGTLYHLEVKEGAYVNSGDLLGLFADLTNMRARAYVDEPDLGQVHVGAEILIHWDARPLESWKGKVQFVPSEVVTRGTRSVAEVLCSIISPPDSLIPNVNVDVDILSNEGRKVTAIPRAALMTEGKDRYVWVIREGDAVRRQVEIGRSTSSFVEVARGVSVGEEVIIPGEAPISEGAKVRVVGK